ncbi:putative membrane protein [Bacteroides fragilis str. S36L5]|nr:putative membrane protein [Bacteroides fragilis str. DS-166]EYA89723.1 putative membrane protein [Bacteroides fragilis str. S36L5]EYB03856.1 putative membrane protein [Bacteroides fragilis str. S6R5]
MAKRLFCCNSSLLIGGYSFNLGMTKIAARIYVLFTGL